MTAIRIDEITRDTPPPQVAAAFLQPAFERTDDQWWTWPNVVSGFHLAMEQRLANHPPFPRPKSERGVVIVGGGKYFPSVYVTVRVLRHLSCNLPIEVWHFDGEIDEPMEQSLHGYGIEFKNADQMQNCAPFRFLNYTWWKGWQLKACALAWCGFREVMLLDADCYPVRNPEYLFEWPEYQKLGAVFWPDLSNSPTNVTSDFTNFFQVERPKDRLTESGQIMLNREQCWRPMQLACLFNECADVVYHYVYGDKDTFPTAWSRAGVDYSRMHPVCQLQADCLLQMDFHGRVIFQHRVLDKFKLENSPFESSPQANEANRYHGQLAHESFCFYALDELRQFMEVPQTLNHIG